ncbi:MAG: hypothetical protein GY953_40925, partial [bacterium]|nr:hypothetical protein [bacterium]
HIQDALSARRSYASTDNIVLDFVAGETMQGGELVAASSPSFKVNVHGTAPILRIDVIKNNRRIYTHSPEAATRSASFTFRDEASFGGNFTDTTMAPTSQITNWAQPETGIRPRPDEPVSYYYIRVLQSFSPEARDRPGEVAWSSPIYVHRR